jgi:hypothetical protein
MEPMIFSSPVRLNPFDFMVKEELNMFLKFEKYILNLGFGMKEIDPSEFSEIIDKTHIVFKTTNRRYGRIPNISVNEFKWRNRSMSRN